MCSFPITEGAGNSPFTFLTVIRKLDIDIYLKKRSLKHMILEGFASEFQQSGEVLASNKHLWGWKVQPKCQTL